MTLLITNFHLNDILTTINFQVRDLDLQARGGDGTEKNFGPIPIIRPLYESDPSKGLEIMRTLIRCPKALRTMGIKLYGPYSGNWH